MSKNVLNAVLIATFGAVAVLPSAAHATLITKANSTDVHFNATDSRTDSTTNGTATSLAAPRNMNTTQLNQFDKSLGVLTGVNVKLNSTYTQSTNVTVAGGGTGANTSGSFNASGTGSSSIKLVVPVNKSSAELATSGIVDGCAGTKVKDACGNGATTKTVNDNLSLSSTDLNAYVGAGTFNVDQYAVTNSASLLSNTFSTTATVESKIIWDGTLNAEYTYLQHASQSFAPDSFLQALTLDFGDVYVGDAVGSKSFSISNLAGERVGLKLTNIAGSGNMDVFSTTLAQFGNLGQGKSNDYTASFSGMTAGMYSATYLLTLGDFLPSNFNYASTSLKSDLALTLNLKANLLERPVQNDVPEPASLMLLGLGGLAFGLQRRRRKN